MVHQPEYHFCVRHSIAASLFASLFLTFVVFVSRGQAQINGAPSSVTSPGFGGRPVNGTPPSVTSLGPRGFTPQFQPTFPISPRPFHHPNEHRRHRSQSEFLGPVIYAVPVPYAVDNGPVEDSDAEDSSDYQGGPTVFDRRGSGMSSYVPGVRDVPPAHYTQANAEDPPAADNAAPPQPPTMLVFRDGHKLEVSNYAIVGATLFDLTPGHTRRIAIADLDVDATRKQNDDRGIVFQLPSAVSN